VCIIGSPAERRERARGNPRTAFFCSTSLPPLEEDRHGSKLGGRRTTTRGGDGEVKEGESRAKGATLQVDLHLDQEAFDAGGEFKAGKK